MERAVIINTVVAQESNCVDPLLGFKERTLQSHKYRSQVLSLTIAKDKSGTKIRCSLLSKISQNFDKKGFNETCEHYEGIKECFRRKCSFTKAGSCPIWRKSLAKMCYMEFNWQVVLKIKSKISCLMRKNDVFTPLTHRTFLRRQWCCHSLDCKREIPFCRHSKFQFFFPPSCSSHPQYYLDANKTETLSGFTEKYKKRYLQKKKNYIEGMEFYYIT